MNKRTNDLLNKLDDMAMGRAYHGDACAEILRTFILSDSERALIERFRDATHTGTDHITLQDFIRETRRNERD